MGKYELKTKVNDASVTDYINQIENEQKRTDAFELIDIMNSITGKEPKMWGGSIIGFDSYHYKYKSGQEGDMLAVGFSPRKAKHSIYILQGFSNQEELMNKLGKHKTGKSCLYINKLDDVSREVLKELISESYNYVINKKWP
ncbi:MAG: hypothetical protein CL840_20800 [Crocinitomicaceae bacterium]|nr:hypothetical protein [Crocinitomicaceae bacterium]|tara:strand:+ start:5419 stop:5844 length:426 start_codon:yes stop_codon:yes gene_type:complete